MPIYDLSIVINSARALNISYRGRKVNTDITNLGYTLQDVAKCVSSLTSCHFVKSHSYEHRIPDDEYRIQFPRTNDDGEIVVDDLYIKFSLIENTLYIDLGSFHLPKYA